MKWIPILLIVITIMSCKTKTPRAIDNSKIKVIKLMTIASYAVEVTDEMFWQSDYAHATMYIVDYNPYLENVTNLKRRVKSNECTGVIYSFISGNDTLYSDNSLKCWRFKEDGHMVYRYDDTGDIAKSLRTIPFFSECW